MAIHVEELLLHRGWLRRLADGMVQSSDLADDLVQETFLVALRGSVPTERSSLRSWLAGVLRNRARMHVRGEVRRHRREQRYLDNPTPATSPAQIVERIEAENQLAQAVLALPTPLRDTVLLRYFEGLSGAEIARRENIPAGTVRWRLHQGLSQLRDTMAPAEETRRLHAVAPAASAPWWHLWSTGTRTSALSALWSSWWLAVAALLLAGLGAWLWWPVAPRPPGPEPMTALTANPLDRKSDDARRRPASGTAPVAAALLVEVTDVNDNAPIFQQSTYNGMITENNSGGDFILVINATDKDIFTLEKT